MSKKLLSEAQVRRFQTLATIRPLNEMESLSAELTEEAPIVEEEEVEMGAEEAPELDADMPEEAEEAEEADVELDEELVQKFVDAVSTIQQVADALGGGEEMEMGAEEEPMDMDAEEEAPEMDMGAEEEPAAEDEEELQLQEALKGIKYVPSQKEVIKVVAQRVAKRLQEAKHAQAKLNKALGKK